MRSAEAGIAWATAAAAELPEGDAWLGPRERQVLEALRPGPRRSSWRLGRFAAKRLLGADVEVLAQPGGAPRAFRDGAPLAGTLSLSHRAEIGLCAAAEAGAGDVGCDVERVEPRSPGFVADYFTPDEQAYVAAAADPELAANLLWSAKESALKALGVGLRRDTRGVEVTVAGAALLVRDREPPRLFRGFWRREGEMVLTFVRG